MTMRFASVSPRTAIRREHRRHRRSVRIDIDAGARREPALVIFQPLFVAKPQIFVADALRARQQRVHELLGLERIGVAAADHLEPFHGVARRVLDARDVHRAHLFVGRENRRNFVRRVAERPELFGKLDGILERELGARADGEVRGVRGVAHQHDMALPLKWLHLPQVSRPKLSHAEPRRWRALLISLPPSSTSLNKLLAEGDRARLVGADRGRAP